MQIELNVFPLENSPGYTIHKLDKQMSLDLQHAFQARGFAVTPEQWGVLNRLWENEGILPGKNSFVSRRYRMPFRRTHPKNGTLVK